MMRRLAITSLLLAACSSFSSSPADPGPDGGTPNDAGLEDAITETPPVQMDAGSAYRAAILEDAPVGYWRMNVKAGSTLVPDETSNKNDLVLNGSGHRFDEEGATTEKGEHAIRFDGITSSAHVGSTAFDFPKPKAFTVECWAKANAGNNTETSPPRYLFERIGAGPSGWAVYVEKITTFVGYHAGTDPDAAQSYATKTLPDDNKFHHVAIVSDGMGTFRLYLDEDVIMPNLEPTRDLVPTAAEFVLGSDQNNTDKHFDGVIDEVAIYDRALTPAQLAHHKQVANGL